MSILRRYVLREHVGPFWFGLSIIVFVLTMDLLLQMINLILAKGVGASTVLELFALNLAWMLALAVPMAVLIATLMAFGRLSSDNEIAALRANGISLHRTSAPILAGSVVLALLLVIFNDRILPESNLRARNLSYAIRRKRPVLALKDLEGVFINDIPGYSIMIEKVDERRSTIHGVTIYELQEGKLPVPIRAERGRLSFSADGDQLILTLYNGEIHQIDESDPDKYLRTRFAKHVIYASGVGQKLVRKDSARRGDREMTIAMMRDKVAGYEEEIRSHRARMNDLGRAYVYKYLPHPSGHADTAGKGHISGSAQPPQSLVAVTQRTLAQLQEEREKIKLKRKMISKYSVEIHKKFSIPVACIVFVLIGIPLGMMGRRSGRAVAIGVSLSFFLLYWAFLIGGEELADRLLVPAAVAMWAPNVLIGAAGIVLMTLTIREGTIIHWERVPRLVPKWIRRKKPKGKA